jgi:hypothetical protein
MRGFYDYWWLEEPWRYAIDKRDDRQWLVAALQDYDLQLRDAYALNLLRKCLTGRSDIRYRYARAWTIGNDEPLPPGQDVVFLARPKLFGLSGFGACARPIERFMCGRIIDPPERRTGDTICYGDRQFTRRRLGEWTEDYRRYDRDYGVFAYRTEEIDGERRQLIALAGLGGLATLLLAVVLAHPRLRRELAQQARCIAPLNARRHRPQEWIEVLIRFELDDASKLDDLLNTLEESLHRPRYEESTFHFKSQVEVVAVSTGAGGREIRYNDASDLADIMLELRPVGGRNGGRLRRIDDGRLIDLPHMRCVLLNRLVVDPDAPVEQLCAELEQERLPGETPEDPHGALRKLVWDLNNDLEPLLGIRPVQKSSKLQRYVLVGVRVEMKRETMPDARNQEGVRPATRVDRAPL